jgi:hypothetical protein
VVLQRLEVALGVRVVVARVRSAETLVDVELRNLSTTLGIELLAFSEPNLVS